MLSSAISALSQRVDSSFLIAYGLPAFLGVLGAVGILTVRVGLERLEGWVRGLDAVEQGLGLLLLLVATVMLAFVFRVLTRPVLALFSGSAFPPSVASWAKERQLRKRSPVALASVEPVAPLDAAQTQPTRFGTVLAAAIEHPHLVYGMDGALWWTRLVPLLPATFQATLSSAQAPMLALLNLSVVGWALALSAVAFLGVAAGQWLPTLALLLAGLLLADLSYRAAVSQAVELGSFVRVAFDLYRHAILTQLGLATPGTLEEERVLWQRLTDQLCHRPAPLLAASGGPDASGRSSDERPASP